MSTIDVLHTRSASQYTGNTLDLMISGDGFFVVQGADGEPLYTRAGNFYVDEAHQLTNGEGMLVQGYDYTPVYTWKKSIGVTRTGSEDEGSDIYGDLVRPGVAVPKGWQFDVDSGGQLIEGENAENAMQYTYYTIDENGDRVEQTGYISVILRDGGLKVDSMGQPVLEPARDELGNVIRRGVQNRLKLIWYRSF